MRILELKHPRAGAEITPVGLGMQQRLWGWDENKDARPRTPRKALGLELSSVLRGWG